MVPHVEGLEGRRLLALAASLVKDIFPGSGHAFPDPFDFDAVPTQFVEMNGSLFFAAQGGTNGTELWKTDGTAAGTVLVKRIS